jgi:hemerythrin
MEEAAMRTGKKSTSIWQESMRVGVPELDEERKLTMDLLELLEVRPIYSIASETFSKRFAVVHAAVEKFIKFEESLLHEQPLPDEIRLRHLADHEKIRTKLHRIRTDSINKKNQTALDVYRSLRTEIKKHVLTFDVEMRKHIPAATAKGRAPEGMGERVPA